MISLFSNIKTASGLTMLLYNGTIQKNKDLASAIANEHKLDMYYLTVYQWIVGSVEDVSNRIQDCLKYFDTPTNLIYIDKAEVLYRNSYDDYLLDPDIEQKIDVLTSYLKNAAPAIVLNLKTYPKTRNAYIKRLHIASEIDTDDVIISNNL